MKVRLEPAARAALCAWTVLTCVRAALGAAAFAGTPFAAPLRAHPLLTAAAFALAAAVLLGEGGLRASGRARRFWAAGAAASAAAFAVRPLAALEPGRIAAALALGGTLPLLCWEAELARGRWDALSPPADTGHFNRLRAALAAGALVAAASRLPASWPMRSGAAPAFALLAISLVAHMALFGSFWAAREAAASAALATGRPAAAMGAADAGLLWALSALLLWRVVLPAAGAPPAFAPALAACWSAAGVAAWAGLGLSRGPGSASVFWRALAWDSARGRSAAAASAVVLLAAVPALAPRGAGDWRAALAAAAAWAFSLAACRPRRADGRGAAWAATVLLGGAAALWLARGTAAAFDAPAAEFDASLRLALRALSTAAGHP